MTPWQPVDLRTGVMHDAPPPISPARIESLWCATCEHPGVTIDIVMHSFPGLHKLHNFSF